MSRATEFGYVVAVEGGYFNALIEGQSFVCLDIDEAVRFTRPKAGAMATQIAKFDKKRAHVVPYVKQEKATQ